MFDELFNKIKTDVETWVKTGVEQVTADLVEKFKLPEPDGDFILVRRFGIADRPITTGGMNIDGNSWRIEAYDDGRNRVGRLVKLFQIDRVANSPECLLYCRAKMRSENITQPVELQLGIEGQVDFFGVATPENTQSYRSIQIPIDSEWQTYEPIYHHYTSRNYPGKIVINLEFKGTGIVWIESVELLQAPVKRSTSA